MLKKTLESPLDCKKIKLVNPKGNQPWIFTGKTNAEVKGQYFWPPDAKSRLVGKDPDGRKDWRQEGKGATEDEMVGWHHWLNGHEFEQTPGDCEGQGSLVCWSPWGHKESDTTERLNWTKLMHSFPNLEPVHCFMSGSNCCFLTCIQVSQEAGKVVWYSHLLKNFPVCCDPHSQRL